MWNKENFPCSKICNVLFYKITKALYSKGRGNDIWVTHDGQYAVCRSGKKDSSACVICENTTPDPNNLVHGRWIMSGSQIYPNFRSAAKALVERYYGESLN